jgi:nucleotide-binding universal stress UspA family protein
MAADSRDGPVLFAYDGSEHAREAIRQAGLQLRAGRRGIVLSVWEPFAAMPFAVTVPPPGLEDGIQDEARKVAEEGAALARKSGFEAEAFVERGDPIWQRIVESAEEHDASIIVMGSHGRTGIGLVLMGSVAAATTRHTDRPVLIAHERSL